MFKGGLKELEIRPLEERGEVRAWGDVLVGRQDLL